jgi:hypothetical protein
MVRYAAAGRSLRSSKDERPTAPLLTSLSDRHNLPVEQKCDNRQNPHNPARSPETTRLRVRVGRSDLEPGWGGWTIRADDGAVEKVNTLFAKSDQRPLSATAGPTSRGGSRSACPCPMAPGRTGTVRVCRFVCLSVSYGAQTDRQGRPVRPGRDGRTFRPLTHPLGCPTSRLRRAAVEQTRPMTTEAYPPDACVPRAGGFSGERVPKTCREVP